MYEMHQYTNAKKAKSNFTYETARGIHWLQYVKVPTVEIEESMFNGVDDDPQICTSKIARELNTFTL